MFIQQKFLFKLSMVILLGFLLISCSKKNKTTPFQPINSEEIIKEFNFTNFWLNKSIDDPNFVRIEFIITLPPDKKVKVISAKIIGPQSIEFDINIPENLILDGGKEKGVYFKETMGLKTHSPLLSGNYKMTLIGMNENPINSQECYLN